MDRIPTALKRLRGNPGRRPLPLGEPMPKASTGEGPTWLPPLGWDFWQRYAPALIQLGLLTELDEPLFAAACERWSAYRMATAPKEQAAALTQARQLLAEFGFTPAARARLASGRPVAEQDPLEAFRQDKRA